MVDLLAPYRRGGKIGLFGGAGVGKTVLIMEVCIANYWDILIFNNNFSFFLLPFTFVKFLDISNF